MKIQIFVCALLLGGTQTGGILAAAHRQTTLRVAGLSEPVEILRDAWGINHIYAKSERDLFFAQGYAAARDRLFQFELWRRQATGTLAEILGRHELKRDIGTRLHMFRGDLKAEFSWYHPHGEEIITSYVRGVNSYIAEALKNPAALPIEFKMLGIKPGLWTPEVIISRHNGLLGNIGEELDMAQAVRVLGAGAVKDIQYFQGPDPDLTIDHAIDASLLKNSILDLYDAFREPVKFTADEIVAAYRGTPNQLARLVEATGSKANDLTTRREDIGSNNWVVSGKLTATGFPLMANDPHRTQAAPSLRYWVHLVAPGWNVIGAGEPVLPGVSIGHNETGAWGLTIFGGDSEDLYVYDTNPANGNQYQYRGSWEEMRIIKDTVAVKGEQAVAVELKYTRHGPVLFEDQEHHKAYALRAAWMDIGSAPYLASLRMDQAKTWQEFRDACTHSRIPSENMVWADRDGNIGYQAAGVAPIRPNWSGLVPVPGDGRYEWGGYLPIEKLPHSYNPEKGYIATANNYLFPRDYEYPASQHHNGADAFRASRISEVLGSGRLHTVAGMIELQNDNVSIPARSLVPLLRELPIPDLAAAKARDLLLQWNDSMDARSVAAGIYEMWQRRLVVNVREVVVPANAQPFIGNVSMKRLIDWMNAPDGRFGLEPIAARDALLVRSFTEATSELTRKLGPDMDHWYWGQEKYHHALIRHQLDEVVKPEISVRLDVGPCPRGGDSYTVNATGGGDNQVSGGSFKIIADTENWENALGLNNPGQSGDPDNRHYRDLFPLWAGGRYFPLAFSRSKVELVTEEQLLLQPQPPSTNVTTPR